MKLKEYKNKRDLARTPEPEPATLRKNAVQYPVFVVQKHAARHLHYDLRLEMDGVLKSWALPKGPSLNPAEKRLAVMVEDHPYEYKDFEGIIPNGNYGAGTVMVWDNGVYSHPVSRDIRAGEKAIRDGLKNGVIAFVLAGVRLKGGFTLIKTRYQKNSWLLIKEKDKYASSINPLEKDRSATTGRTMEEIAANVKIVRTARLTKTETGAIADQRKPRVTKPEFAGRPGPMPHLIRPMLATAIKKPFDHPDWMFEVKWDGFRAIAEVDPANATLYSRNQLPLNDQFPAIAAALKNLGVKAVLDGEITAWNKKGLPDFQLLAQGASSSSAKLVYFVFDILYCQGRDVRMLPLARRKELLKEILPASGTIRLSEHVWKDGILFFNAAQNKGLEGIVAKEANSPYLEGTRSKAWLKIKNQQTQDCVITGFTQPKGGRKYLGSLVLGTYDKGNLVYVGHSGGAFGGKTIREMHAKLAPLAQKKCPFRVRPPGKRETTWIKPILVCEVSFTMWTDDGIMRHPLFVRFREDKTPEEAIREMK